MRPNRHSTVSGTSTNSRLTISFARHCSPTVTGGRVLFQFPTSVRFERMDETFPAYGASINMNDKTLTLTKGEDKNWKASFTFHRPAGDQLILDGYMDNHKIHMQLQLVDHNKFPLINRRFHCIQEYPDNR